MSYLKDFQEKQLKLRNTGRTVKMIHNVALKLLSCELDFAYIIVDNNQHKKDVEEFISDIYSGNIKTGFRVLSVTSVNVVINGLNVGVTGVPKNTIFIDHFVYENLIQNSLCQVDTVVEIMNGI